MCRALRDDEWPVSGYLKGRLEKRRLTHRSGAVAYVANLRPGQRPVPPYPRGRPAICPASTTRAFPAGSTSKPREIVLDCPSGNELQLRWTTYTATKGVAIGTSLPCRGSKQAVTVTVSRPVRHEFTRMTIAYHGFGTVAPLALAVGRLGISWEVPSFITDPSSGLRLWP